MSENMNTEEREAVVVKNRDIPMLADIWCIMQEIRLLSRRRDFQHDQMLNITQHLSAMPKGGGLPKGIDDALAMLSELDSEHEAKCREYVRKMKKAEKILNGIRSQTIRTFVQMKYVMNVPDQKIREELNMGRKRFERAKRAVEDAGCMAEIRWKEPYILR